MNSKQTKRPHYSTANYKARGYKARIVWLPKDHWKALDLYAASLGAKDKLFVSTLSLVQKIIEQYLRDKNLLD